MLRKKTNLKILKASKKHEQLVCVTSDQTGWLVINNQKNLDLNKPVNFRSKVRMIFKVSLFKSTATGNDANDINFKRPERPIPEVNLIKHV